VVRVDCAVELVVDWVGDCAIDWAVRSSQSLTCGTIDKSKKGRVKVCCTSVGFEQRTSQTSNDLTTTH
jgi:hypothetical protein